MLDGDADFGIATPLKRYPELDYAPILSDPFGVIMPSDHPLAVAEGPVRWADLAPYDFIGLANDTGIGAFLESYPELRLARHAVPGDQASSTTSLYAMLRMGGKISVLPQLAAQTTPMTEFRFRPLAEPAIEREVCLITRQLRASSPNAKRLLDALMDTVRRIRV